MDVTNDHNNHFLLVRFRDGFRDGVAFELGAWRFMSIKSSNPLLMAKRFLSLPMACTWLADIHLLGIMLCWSLLTTVSLALAVEVPLGGKPQAVVINPSVNNEINTTSYLLSNPVVWREIVSIIR